MAFTKENLQNQMGHASRHFYKKLRSVIKNQTKLDQMDQVLVGVSGGMDSAVLLYGMFCYHCLDNGPKITVAHINHGIRGAFAKRDQNVAQKLAERFGVAFVEYELDPETTTNEAGLRALRLDALKDLACSVGAKAVLLAHHQDDQAETLLLKLFRGADLRGLGAMRLVRDDFWIRPLLSFAKKELSAVAQDASLLYAEDETNQQTHLTRNFLRHQVLPLCKAHVNPNISSHLSKVALSMAQVDDLIESQARKARLDIERDTSGHWDCQKLQALHIVIRKRLYQNQFQDLEGEKDRMLSHRQLQTLDDMVLLESGYKTVELSKRVRVVRDQDVLIFNKLEKI